MNEIVLQHYGMVFLIFTVIVWLWMMTILCEDKDWLGIVAVLFSIFAGSVGITFFMMAHSSKAEYLF